MTRLDHTARARDDLARRAEAIDHQSKQRRRRRGSALTPATTHRSKLTENDDGTFFALCGVCDWHGTYDTREVAENDTAAHRRWWRKGQDLEGENGPKTCNRCGVADLHWIRTGEGWHLGDRMQNIHRCRGPG